MPKTSIIIPVCDNANLTDDCIKSIHENTTDYEIIIVDNGSKIPYALGDKIIRNNQNRGFPVAVNQGIKAATGEIIVILNNDTLVTAHWLEYLQTHLKKYDLVGPMTNNISGPQKLPPGREDARLTFEQNAVVIHEAHNGDSVPLHRLVFFCVAIKAAVFDKIGFLDEDFSPGNFEDDDFCLRAIAAGFKLGMAEDVAIFHYGSMTHKSLNVDYARILEKNQAHFELKWPKEKYFAMLKKNIDSCAGVVTTKKPTLALVMIVKNEEQGLEKAILSCKDFVDEIVIAVDKETTDGTAGVARRYATTLKFFDWKDNFAEARNFAHADVKSDWILFLDGHEYVKQHDQLAEYLKSAVDGLMCAVEMENGIVFRNPRIYRRGFNFSGAVHEEIDCKTYKQYPEFIVKHNRLEGQSLAARNERQKQHDDMVPRIMGARYRTNKNDLQASFHLALHAQTKGFPKEAIKWWKRYLHKGQDKGARWFAYFEMTLAYMLRGQLFWAWWFVNRADWETPGRWEIVKLKGMIWFAKGEYQKALECLVGTFYQNEGIVNFKPMVRDDADTWNLCGECFFRLGNLEKAHLAFEQAVNQAKDNANRKFFAQRAALMKEMLIEQTKVDKKTV